MGGKQIRPARVYKTVLTELQNDIIPGRTVAKPPWHDIMHQVPPSESLVRMPPVRHSAPNQRVKKPKNLYRPQRIHYPEDALRTTFYKDHPWELARPRIIVETDGKDYQRCDWSKGLRQPGFQLSGECVVQRQLYLMQSEGMGRQKAYDAVRREFYRLRQEEEIEKRVALEEAKHVGAYFGKSRLDVGLQLEDREYENWKVWAGKQAEKRESREVEDEEDIPEVNESPMEALAQQNPLKRR